MNIDIALEKIYSLKQFHVKLGLENITDLLNYIGNPQNKLKTFHVAGSNGKGSTCSFIASILQEFGYIVGLYTSPHFVHFNERIRINGKEIPDQCIIDFLERNKEYIDGKKPTFFEITTALAFEYFSSKKVDYAVIETGLGGRLDATNILKPLASIITSISLEHVHILGDSLEKIAHEKAGIIKERVPVFIGKLPLEAREKIKLIAQEKNTLVNDLYEYIHSSNGEVKLKLGEEDFQISKTGVKGRHQLVNAALAVLTLNFLLGIKESKKIKKGLDNIIQNTGIQGRYEKYGLYENILFDSAHNLEGIQIFLDEFKSELNNFKKCDLIFGVMVDKDIAGMLRLLNPYFENIYAISIDNERAASAEDIHSIAKKNKINVTIIDRTFHLIDEFQNKRDECLVILGSIYLLGQIKKEINSKK